MTQQPKPIHEELRRYVMQFTFRCGLSKEDNKPFWCMCPKCWIPVQWKTREHFGWFLFNVLLTLIFFQRHQETSNTITSFRYTLNGEIFNETTKTNPNFKIQMPYL